MSIESNNTSGRGDEIPKRPTLQENPRHITDKELDEARIDTTIILSYQDLMDNLTMVEKDLEFVTGKENRKELEERRTALKNLIKYHPTTEKIGLEDQKNFEGGMSFNEDQKYFIKLLAGDYSHLDDYGAYLNAKDVVEKYKNLTVEQVVRDHDKERRMPDTFRNKNVGQLFAELFPQSGSDKQIPLDL